MINSFDIKLFRSLFNGREDAFAIRWEKGNKSGYMPPYQFDPYHAKFLKVKSIRVNLSYKIEFGKIKSYIAFSEDLDKINRELVEAVKFRFVTKTLIGRIPDLNSDNLLDVQQLQESSVGNSLYKSGALMQQSRKIPAEILSPENGEATHL